MDGYWSGHGNEECGACHTGFVLQPADNHIVSKRTSAGCRMQVSDKSKTFPTGKEAGSMKKLTRVRLVAISYG
jgi:hypothetical protein